MAQPKQPNLPTRRQRAEPSQTTSYVTAPPSPVDAADPLLRLALRAFSACGSESTPVQ